MIACWPGQKNFKWCCKEKKKKRYDLLVCCINVDLLQNSGFAVRTNKQKVHLLSTAEINNIYLQTHIFAQASQLILQEGLAQWQHDEMKGNVQSWMTEPHNLLWTAPLWSGWTHTEHSQSLICRYLHQVHSSHLLFKKKRGRGELGRVAGGVHCMHCNECPREESCVIVDTQAWPWLMLLVRGRYIPCLNSVNCIWCRCFPNQACCFEQTPFPD